MTNTELPKNNPNRTNENELNASLGYIAVFHPSEVSLETDEANKTLTAIIPVSLAVSLDQVENYLKGGKIDVSVGYKIDPSLATKNANLFKQKRIVNT